MPFSRDYTLWQATFGAIVGSVAAFAPGSIVRRIEKRMREGDDRYFEEQRELRSYPILRNRIALRVIGALILAGSAWLFWDALG